MANKPVRFHPEAEQEFLQGLSWYRARSLLAAARFEEAVERAVSRIVSNPRAWPAYFDQYQKYNLQLFPFILVYEEHLSEIVVLAVAHASLLPMRHTQPAALCSEYLLPICKDTPTVASDDEPDCTGALFALCRARSQR